MKEIVCISCVVALLIGCADTTSCEQKPPRIYAKTPEQIKELRGVQLWIENKIMDAFDNINGCEQPTKSDEDE